MVGLYREVLIVMHINIIKNGYEEECIDGHVYAPRSMGRCWSDKSPWEKWFMGNHKFTYINIKIILTYIYIVFKS